MKTGINFLRNLSSRLKGLLYCLVISVSLLYFFFGTILSSPNKYYFDKSGDGLLTYYYAAYQLKYDTTYWHLSASNYPHGESVFFSSDQPVLTAGLRFINNNLFKVEDYIPGIFNVLMLFSFVLCALFIYLILYEFKVPFVFAALCAVGIAFMSPQLARIQFHFPLSYAFSLPMFFYLLLKFDKDQKYKTSFIIGLFVFLMACLHIYFLGFFGAILIVYYVINLMVLPNKLQVLKKSAITLFIQLILPFIILQFCINLTSDITDRTSYPWGFLLYISNIDGLFFPYGKPYQTIIEKYHSPLATTKFEGMSYVGLFAIITSIIFLLNKLIHLFTFRFKKFIFLSEYKMLTVFLVAGIITAFYACGVPYIFNEKLISYIGPLRQMRGLGRFAWLLFYSLNIFCVYYIVRLATLIKYKPVKVIIYVLSLLILFYDAYYTVKPIGKEVANKMPILEDRENNLPENKWVKEIDAQRYQAIIPLPYFLQGSENIGIDPEQREIIGLTYMASLKTGLPITAAVLSRTSLSQTYDNVALILEPYRPLQILKHCPNKKPFLLLVRNAELNSIQKDLVNKAIYLRLCDGFNLYEMPYNTLAIYTDSLYTKTNQQLAGTRVFGIDQWLSTSFKKNFAYKSFDDEKSSEVYRGKGARETKIKEYSRIFEDTIPGASAGQNFVMSFWMQDFTKDLYPRSMMEIIYLDSATNNVYGGKWINPAGCFKALDGSWALIELLLKPVRGHDKIQITVWNSEFYDNSKLIIDELLIRPEETDLYRIFPDEIEKNNRFYKGKFEMTDEISKMLKRVREEAILEFEKQMRNSPPWLKQIEEKAKARHKSVDEIIKMDAEWLWEEREKAGRTNSN